MDPAARTYVVAMPTVSAASAGSWYLYVTGDGETQCGEGKVPSHFLRVISSLICDLQPLLRHPPPSAAWPYCANPIPSPQVPATSRTEGRGSHKDPIPSMAGPEVPTQGVCERTCI